MSFVLSGSPTSGLASAAALLQVELGIGLVLGALGIASNTAAIQKQLADAPWEAALRAAAKAVAPVPVLVASALLQARAAPDVFVSVGFLVSSTAIAFGAFLAVLGNLIDSEDDDTPRFVKATNVLSACRAFGQTLLVFAALPEGAALFVAASLVRAVLAAQAAGAVVGIVAPGSAIADVLAELEAASSLAPVFTAMALLNHEGTVFFQPALYGLVQFGLVASTLFVGDAVAAAQSAVSGVLTISMVLGLGSLLMGTFGVELSLGGILIQWGDPLAATAVGLCILILGVHVMEYIAGMMAEAPAKSSNGVDGEDHEDEKVPTVAEYLKMLTAPAHVLLLALVANRITYSPLDSDMDTFEAFSFFAVAPFRYGFCLTALAVKLQVIAFVVYVVGRGDAAGALEPPFDVTGTLRWEAKGGASKQVGDAVQWLTHALLVVGLFLGCIGLGPVTWAIGCVATFGFLYLAAPAKGRNHLVEVTKALFSAILASGGSTFSFLETFLEQRRAAQFAAASQRAAALAEALENESAPRAKSAHKAPAFEKKAAADQVAGGSKGKAAKGGKKK